MKLLNKVSDSLVHNPNQSSATPSRVASNKAPKGGAVEASRNRSAAGDLKNLLPEKLNAVRFSRWSELGGAQLKYNQFKSAEGSLGSVYRELVNVNMQLNRKLSNPEKMAARLRQLDAKVNSDLNTRLKPKVMNAESDRPDYVLKSVDLLSKKPAETLNLVLPSAGKSVSFHVPAYAEPSKVVESINKSLASADIKVSLEDGKNLIFSPNEAQRRAFDEPVLFAGEGIRVPAGNPVPVQMMLKGSALTSLADAIESESDKDEINDQVRQVQNDVRYTIVQLRYYMDQIRNKPDVQEDEVDISSVETDLNRLLRDGDFGSRLTSLLAQANISRDTAVSLLNKSTKSDD